MEDEILYDKDGKIYERKGNNWYEPKWDMWNQRQAVEDNNHDLEFTSDQSSIDGTKLYRKQSSINQQTSSTPDISTQLATGIIKLIFMGLGKLFEPRKSSKPQKSQNEKTFLTEGGVVVTSRRIVVNKDQFWVRDISLASATRWTGSKYEMLLRIESSDKIYAIHSSNVDKLNRIEAAIREAIYS